MVERRKISPQSAFEETHAGLRIETYGMHLPHVDLARTIMHAAACEEFGLRPAFSTEGGVHGVIDGDPVEYSNWPDSSTLGVIDELTSIQKPRPGNERLRDFYFTFILDVYGDELRTGEIFRTQISRRDFVNDLFELLKQRGGDDLLNGVARRIVDPFERTSFKGLSDEEIAQYYIEPPADEQ